MNLLPIPWWMVDILDQGEPFTHASGVTTTQASPHGPNGERHPRGEVCRCKACRVQQRLWVAA